MVLRNSLKEMMTPELASRTLQLYTGLMEDFFGLPARAPEVHAWWQVPHLHPVTSWMPYALRAQRVNVTWCTCAQCPIMGITDNVIGGAAAGARAHG